MKNRFVITGVGPIGSTGIGKDSFWHGVQNRNLSLDKVKVNVSRDDSIEFFLHRVNDFSVNNFGINSSSLEYINKWKDGKPNRDLELMVAATKLGLEDAKIDYSMPNPNLSFIVTHENPCLEQFIKETYSEIYGSEEKEGLFLDVFNRTVKTGYETQSFMLLFHLARVFNIHNYSLVINNACASGMYALESAADLIRVDKAKQVAIIAGDSPDVYKHLWFKLINMCDDTGKIKAFCKASNGFVMGEGAICLVLEEYEHAIRRGAYIYAEYTGGGFFLESWGVTTPRIGDDCLQRCINKALEISSIGKESIDLICAHGAGTLSSDYYEGMAVMDIFGDKTPLTTFKGYLGHTLGASSLLELSLLVLSMQNENVPSILNTKEFDSRLKINFVNKDKKMALNYCLKLCNAFAGFNAAVVLKRI